MEIVMNPIGYIRNNVTSKKDISWGEDYSTIVLEEQYAMGLKGLERTDCGNGYSNGRLGAIRLNDMKEFYVL